MFQFEKPGRDYSEMAVESVTKALKDAKINVQKVDQAVVGFVKSNSSFIFQIQIYELYVSLNKTFIILF